MLLSPQDALQFFTIHRSLMFFVNERLDVLPDNPKTPLDFAQLSPEKRAKVRDAFLDELDLIEKFVDENPAEFSDDELEIVLSWHHLVAGQFFIFRYLTGYTIFLATDEPAVAYGVVALSEPLDRLVGPYLPVMARAVLLPFKGKIVYDGLLNSYPIIIGGGIRRSLNETYRTAKARCGIVTSLPMPENQAIAKNASPKKKSSAKGTKAANSFQGRWRIEWMEQRDQDFVDEEVAGFFEFGPNRSGSFQFGYVRGQIDYLPDIRGGVPGIEFSWEGSDELTPAQGRGWATLADDELQGRIYFHQGDDSAFKARRAPVRKQRRKK